MHTPLITTVPEFLEPGWKPHPNIDVFFNLLYKYYTHKGYENYKSALILDYFMFTSTAFCG